MNSGKPSVPSPGPSMPPECRSIEWYSEGESRIVEVDGIRMTVRFVSRKGRRARIAITTPSGAVFRGAGQDGQEISPE